MTIVKVEKIYEHWPIDNIKDPGLNDVMCGRGGATNNHPGNVKFRKLVNEHKSRYFAASKINKPKVAQDVVHIWRTQKPPGRFLNKTFVTIGTKFKEILWHDVGDQKAREKASQCLREKNVDVMEIVEQPHKKKLKRQHGNSRKPVSLVFEDENNREFFTSQEHFDSQKNHDLKHQIDIDVSQDFLNLVQNPESAAVALLDPRTSDNVAKVLRKLSSGDDDSVDAEASVRSIAISLGFADQPFEHDDDELYQSLNPTFTEYSYISNIDEPDFIKIDTTWI